MLMWANWQSRDVEGVVIEGSTPSISTTGTATCGGPAPMEISRTLSSGTEGVGLTSCDYLKR